jgi:hypothetical protein
MRISLLIIVICIFSSSIKAQQQPRIKSPEPAVGWIVFSSKIVDSELAIRADMEANFKVTLTIDSTGAIKNINIPNTYTYDSLFDPMIVNAINAVKWYPGTRDGVPISMNLFFLLSISLKGKKTVSMDFGTIATDISTRIKIDSIRQSY